MYDRYPPIDPYESGMLDVGDGHLIHWETCGNPYGKPALVLHGGPGSGCTPGWRRDFDPEAYRIVLFDQRGCGRSTPNAAQALQANTTHHLLADIERLRRHLGIDRWLVLGGSWGTTLMTFARLVTHYWRHAAWLEDGILIREAGKLTGIPGVLINGRLDISGPPDTAWHLAQAWPDAELILIDEAGHGAHAKTNAALIDATRRFATQH